MSAQHTIAPPAADLPRWTPVLVPPVAADDRGRPATLTSARAAHAVASLRPPTRAAAWRRRLGAVVVLVLLAFLLTAGIGRVTAGAQLADPVAGSVTIGPGETLWDVAAATAPPGVGVADQLAAINALNGFDSASIDPWTVVLVPAR